MTREEAAAYLKVSVRTFDRLSLRRAHVGRLVRVWQSELDTYLRPWTVTPSPIALVPSGGRSFTPRRPW